MSRRSEEAAPTTWLVGAVLVLGALAAVLATAIRPPAEPPRSPPEGASPDTPAGTELEAAPDADRIPIGTTVLAAEVPAPAAVPASRAHHAVVSLAASIDPTRFRAPSFEVEARALASELDAEDAQELALAAGDAGRPAAERVAAAEILRHLAPGELPAAGLATLRSAWLERAGDPVLAAASVRALGAFGDAADRAEMLADAGELSCAGLSAARGDEAALELVGALGEGADPRRAGIALAALTAIASASDAGLSDAARAGCARALLAIPQDVRPDRLLGAAAAFDPEIARAPLLAVIADAKAGGAAVQSAASALATMPEAEPGLRQLLRDEGLDTARRALAAEALLRLDADPWGEARSALERARDGASGTAVQGRAARVLDHHPIATAFDPLNVFPVGIGQNVDTASR